MEVNKEEALRCLSIAQRHRDARNYSSALKFAKKSVTMYGTPEGEKLVQVIEEEMTFTSTTSSSAGEAKARASGVEEHVTSARQRHPEKPKVEEKRSFTAKQMEVVTRVKRCGHTAYYEILAGKWRRRGQAKRVYSRKRRTWKEAVPSELGEC